MVTAPRPLNILCLACFNTGDRFIQRAKERGARVFLLTKETYLKKKRWRRDLLEDVFAEPDGATLAQTVSTVSYLARTIKFDRIIPFDDVEVDAAARLREHLRVPGMGDTRARVFRDKLAMRIRAEEEGFKVPAFVGVIHHDDIRAFTERVPPPWMLKPRTEASSTGIQRIGSADELWKAIEALGDRASHFLLEQYLPGDVHHVDAIVTEGKVVFTEVHKNGIPPFDVSHGGGVFTTFTVERGSPDWRTLEAFNEKILTRFGLLRGVAHLEYIKAKDDGEMYFLEAGARVGGAHVANLVEAATGINLWAEWCDIEIDKGTVPYTLPTRRFDYGGLVQSLARTESPDMSAYGDSEVAARTDDPFHAGLVLRSADHGRVRTLIESYSRRFADDFLAVAPHYELPRSAERIRFAMTALNALSSSDRVEPLFPEGHALRRLVRPSFDTIRRTLKGRYVATIWMDASMDPTRAGFRPSYEALYGPGAGSLMAFVGAWLSTGPGSDDGGNVVLFPEDIDRTLLDWGQRVGLLGPFEMVAGVAAMKERVAKAKRRLYNIDDLGADFDPWSVVSSELSRRMNSKDDLSSITRFGPIEVVKDMGEVGRDDFEAARRGGGRVFLKTCNTENAGLGVFIASTPDEFDAHIETIRAQQQRFGLSRLLVVQQEIVGQNRSFQVFLDPDARDVIQVVALSDQLVEADGKTYRSSVNHAITAENVEPVGDAILDMVDRVWSRHPEAYGFMMSDYFATANGPVIYDPGLRPTGNTATALAAHLARKLTGQHFMASLVPLPTGRQGRSFADFARRAGTLVDPESLVTRRRALFPWGWNPIQGFGMIIAVAEDQASVDALCAELLRSEGIA